eukprot:scaffold593_cov382-Prasinococcus_capsulatus_cf.AAC.13
MDPLKLPEGAAKPFEPLLCMLAPKRSLWKKVVVCPLFALRLGTEPFVRARDGEHAHVLGQVVVYAVNESLTCAATHLRLNTRRKPGPDAGERYLQGHSRARLASLPACTRSRSPGKLSRGRPPPLFSTPSTAQRSATADGGEHYRGVPLTFSRALAVDLEPTVARSNVAQADGDLLLVHVVGVGAAACLLHLRPLPLPLLLLRHRQPRAAAAIETPGTGPAAPQSVRPGLLPGGVPRGTRGQHDRQGAAEADGGATRGRHPAAKGAPLGLLAQHSIVARKANARPRRLCSSSTVRRTLVAVRSFGSPAGASPRHSPATPRDADTLPDARREPRMPIKATRSIEQHHDESGAMPAH